MSVGFAIINIRSQLWLILQVLRKSGNMGAVTVFSLGVTGGKLQMAWAVLLPTTE